MAGALFLAFAPTWAQQGDSVTRSRAPLFVTALPDSVTPFPRATSVYTAVAPASGPLPVLLYPSLQPALGRVAGVQVTPFSGAPGTNMALRIRGVASILGTTQPLILLDGMPVYTSGAPGSIYLLNGRAAQPNFTTARTISVDPPEDTNLLLGIAPEDIDSVEIVKSAFGTARYGSLGSNGVVHIRTRRGVGARPAQITYSGYGGVQHVARRYELLGAREYAELANEVSVKRGQAPMYSAAQLAEFSRTGGTNWQDEVLQTATTQSHHVGLRGRGTRTAYAASAGYLRQNGVVLNSHLARYAFRLNVDQQITPRLQISGRAALTRTNRRRPDEDYHNSLYDALRALPTLPVRDATGRFTHSRIDFFGPSSFHNPVQELLESYHDQRTQQALMQLTAHYQLATGVRATLAAGHERNKLEAEGYSNEQLFPADSPKIRAYETKATHRTTFLAAGIALNRAFADHLITASLGYERLGIKLAENRGYFYSASAFGALQTGSATPISSGTAMGSYTFRQRYALEASLRADHTPFHAARWFPGAQLTWHLGQEAWAPTPWVGDAHFWVGTGRTSNRGFAKPQATTSGGLSGLYNPAAYERTWQYEAGGRSAWRAGRLTASLVAYRRRSSDLEMTTYYYSPTGGPALTPVFVGEVRNQGVEATVSAGWHLGPLQGTTAVAAATNANLVEKIPENTGFYIVDRQRVAVGKPLGAFYGYEQNGTFPAGQRGAGQRRYDAFAQPGGGEVTYLGSSGLPRHSLNVVQTLAWRRWHLDLQADGLFGYRVLNYQLNSLDNPTGTYNATTRVRQRWTPANPDTDIPIVGSGDFISSQRVLENGNHLRLTQGTLTMDVVQTPRARVSVWAGGTNLLLLTRYRGFDPNVSSAQLESARPGVDYGAYPTARTLLVGLRATL
ncbi:TonB-dependent receptor [Hymenobacter fastidiosus]|uniref:TonB-dependent receptor n=1 Tax=Hymenobacter fastidiosus TaxID=486264 RepID=A0ABP7RJU6_9BACT